MLSSKFVTSLLLVASAILLDHVVESEPSPSGSPSRQRSGSSADVKQAAAKATTSEGSNFATTSANDVPGTTKKTIRKDGTVTIESASDYVSPDGQSRSSSRSSSTSTSSANPNGRSRGSSSGHNKQTPVKAQGTATEGRNSRGSNSVDGKQGTSAKAQAATSKKGQNFASTSANGVPGTTKKTVTKDGVVIESTMEQISPDGMSRSFSKSVSSSKHSP